jgi:hypothetical protein
MYRPVAVKPALGMGLLVLLILVMSACSEEAHARKIPEGSDGRSMKSIPAGKYVSDEFRPAMSFKLNEGWQTGPAADFSYGRFLEKYNRLTLSRVSESEPSFLEFLVVPKVYKVVSSYFAKEESAPEDMASWLQNNPNLDAENPESMRVGGVKGEQFDAVASRIPQDYLTGGYHGVNTYHVRHGGNVYDDEPCLPLFQTLPNYGRDSTYELCQDYKVRFIVLEEVNGKTVTVAVLAPTVKFDETWLKAQRVLNTVEWKGI